MKKLSVVCMVFFFSFFYSYGQKGVEAYLEKIDSIQEMDMNAYLEEATKAYMKLFEKANAIKNSEQLGVADTVSIYTQARVLDKEHPMAFFQTAAEYLSKYQLNEAAFFYKLGGLRYTYFNKVSPDYEPGGDGALFTSFQYILGESLNMYLKANVDNFITILEQTSYYFSTNDFVFFSKENDNEIYDKVLQANNNLIADIKTNKKKYAEEWGKEMESIIELLNSGSTKED